MVDQFYDAHKTATDLRLRVAVRDEDGNAVGTLGQAAVMAVLGDGTEILLAGPGDSGNAAGFTLPSELGAAMYIRSIDLDLKSQFFQLDGRVNTPTSIGSRVFYSKTKGADLEDTTNLAVKADIVDLPEFEPGDLTATPSFRLRSEIMRDGLKQHLHEQAERGLQTDGVHRGQSRRLRQRHVRLQGRR